MTTSTVERVYAILSPRNPRIELAPGLPLGPEGLGLDSIALVDVLLECEQAFRVELASELLAGEPLTIGLLVDALQARLPD